MRYASLFLAMLIALSFSSNAMARDVPNITIKQAKAGMKSWTKWYWSSDAAPGPSYPVSRYSVKCVKTRAHTIRCEGTYRVKMAPGVYLRFTDYHRVCEGWFVSIARHNVVVSDNQIPDAYVRVASGKILKCKWLSYQETT